MNIGVKITPVKNNLLMILSTDFSFNRYMFFTYGIIINPANA